MAAQKQETLIIWIVTWQAHMADARLHRLPEYFRGLGIQVSFS